MTRLSILLAVASIACLASAATVAPKLLDFEKNMTLQTTAPPAGSTWSGSVVFELKGHATDFVVGKDVVTSPQLFGLKNLTLHGEALAGYQFNTGKPVAGAAGVFRFALSAADTAEVGLAAIYSPNSTQPFKGNGRLALELGVSHRF